MSLARKHFSGIGAFARQFVDKRFMITTAIVSLLVGLGLWVAQDGGWDSLPVFLTIVPAFQWLWFLGAYLVTHCGTLLYQHSSWKSLAQWAPLAFLLAYIAGTYALFSTNSLFSLVEQ